MKLSAFLFLTIVLVGCGSSIQRTPPLQVWPDMKWQVKPYPQGASDIFSDGRAARPPVVDTVARGYVAPAEDAYTTGINAKNEYVGKNLEPITPELMKLGQTKFNIYCTPCHSRVGDGKGIVALRTPSWQPSNLHEQRVRDQADGQTSTPSLSEDAPCRATVFRSPNMTVGRLSPTCALWKGPTGQSAMCRKV